MSLAKKKRILIISPRFPYPPHKGDQLVVFNCIKYLSLKYDVDLISFYDEDIESRNFEKVNQYCKEIKVVKLNKINAYIQILKSFFTDVPMQVAYFKSKKYQDILNNLLVKNKYELLLPFTLRMSQYVEHIDSKKYIHLIDSMYLNMKRRSDNESGLKKIIFQYEAKKVSIYEKKLIVKYDKSFVVSQIDKNVIDKYNNKIEVFPNGVEVYNCSQKSVNENSLIIVFSGNMGYFPNQEAVIWFIENCWEKVLQLMPNAIFRIVGKNPSRKIKSMALQYNNIEVIGFVESVKEELCKANIAIAPMQSGSGMQNKILEAMAVKIPVITSTLGLGDIKAEIGKDILIADTPDEFVKQIKYLSDNKHQQEIGNNGYNYVLEKHSWKSIIFSKIQI